MDYLYASCINYISISINYLSLVHPDPLSQTPSPLPRRPFNKALNLRGAYGVLAAEDKIY